MKSSSAIADKWCCLPIQIAQSVRCMLCVTVNLNSPLHLLRHGGDLTEMVLRLVLPLCTWCTEAAEIYLYDAAKW